VRLALTDGVTLQRAELRRASFGSTATALVVTEPAWYERKVHRLAMPAR
jgi:hypothetical protein